MTSWTDKYRPRKLEEVVGQKAVEDFENWHKNWNVGKKAALLWGRTGVGKTAAVYALAEERKLELIEINASDVRNAQGIEETVGHSNEKPLVIPRHFELPCCSSCCYHLLPLRAGSQQHV